MKESDFLGFQKIKMGKTIENYKKAIKTNNIQLHKNKTELESKEKQIVELNSKIESLKKEVSILKSKNSALLTNETVFAIEKKKYLESVENTLKKAILQESIKIPNLRNLNDTERKDKMIEILEKISKDNNIPISAFVEIFKNPNNTAHFFALLHFDGYQENNAKSMRYISQKSNNQSEEEPEKSRGLKR